ncbi:unnamed protein product [Paramecium octaurelia]|uniref:Uncharacterized protein n=1 Tax=Paramecium octaurelia TaxID=43137 RepID=A0A8S1SV60_PAROT|nr:unnamed protein product [Paramecium octaurelia]
MEQDFIRIIRVKDFDISYNNSYQYNSDREENNKGEYISTFTFQVRLEKIKSTIFFSGIRIKIRENRNFIIFPNKGQCLRQTIEEFYCKLYIIRGVKF